MSLDFDRLREANWTRANEFFGDVDQWSLLERCGEMTGEAGEAANVAKKLKRGWKMKNGERTPFSQSDIDSMMEDLADELADVIITADLVAGQAGIDLGARVVKKFNEKSDKWNAPHRL